MTSPAVKAPEGLVAWVSRLNDLSAAMLPSCRLTKSPRS